MGGVNVEGICSMEDIVPGGQQDLGRKAVVEEGLNSDTSGYKVAAKVMMSKNGEDGEVEQTAITNAKYLAWARDRVPGKFSQYLNLCICIAQVSNYYVTVPTSADYAARVGAPKSFSGILLGAITFTTLCLTFVWGSIPKRLGYMNAIMVSLTIGVAGNVLYALAATTDSFWALLASRVFIGLGWCAPVNAKWIQLSFGTKTIRTASGQFATASALGVCAGVGVAAILSPIDLSAGPIYFDKDTLPGWTYVVILLALIILTFLFFEEPEQPVDDDDFETLAAQQKRNTGKKSFGKYIPMTVLVSVTASGRFALCAFESGAPLVTEDKFSWSTMEVSAYLAVLGAIVFPANFLYSRYLVKVLDDRKMVLVQIGITVAGLLLLTEYYPDTLTIYQYALGGVLLFAGTAGLVSAVMALMAQINDFESGTFNTGTLIVVGMSIGRACGAVYGTQFYGYEQQENFIVLASFVIMIGSAGLFLLTYKRLKPLKID